MSDNALPEDWEILRSWLPEDLDTRARKHGFIRRSRGLCDSELWLRLFLMHVAGGLSLEQTVLRACELGLADVSAVALFKRLRKAQAWLQDLCAYLLGQQRRRLGHTDWPSDYQVRAIDATDVQEPGSTGTAWRVHYSIRLPELVCDHYELTSRHGGEKLGRFQFSPHDLVLADRGYSHRAGVASVIDSGANVLVRWNPFLLPVEEADGQAFDLLAHLRTLPAGQPGQWPVRFHYASKPYELRLCALRKSRTAAQRAHRKALDKARRNGTIPDERALELTQYVLLLTTLPPERFAAPAVLELYRCRWQVELAFKRLKSLMGAGHVPKNDDQSAPAWMQAKLLTALLLERLLFESRAFSPWGYPLRGPEPLEALHGSP